MNTVDSEIAVKVRDCSCFNSGYLSSYSCFYGEIAIIEVTVLLDIFEEVNTTDILPPGTHTFETSSKTTFATTLGMSAQPVLRCVYFMDNY